MDDISLHFHRGLSGEDVEELPGAMVKVADLGGAGRHAFFDYAERVVLDEMPKSDWVKVNREGTHWIKGFYIAKLFAKVPK